MDFLWVYIGMGGEKMSVFDFSFPEGFLWGAATSSHQIEGNCKFCNWWEWENSPGKITAGHTSEIACDHWNRYKEDFSFLKKMNLNAYRFSIEWAKVFPERNKKDEEVLEQYNAQGCRTKLISLLIQLVLESI